MTKVYIATSRPIGEKCKEWAKRSLPPDYVLSDKMNDCDIFISVLYDKIIPLEYIKGLRGAFNFHPGALPEYRGAATFSWAIVNGEDRVGITLHKIDEGIDSGDIISIRYLFLEQSDTAETLFAKAEQVIFNMFQEWFDKLLLGEFNAVKQDESKARIYYRKDLDKLKDLTRIVRALHFPGKESCFFYTPGGTKKYINYEAS